MARLASIHHPHCEICGHPGKTTPMMTWGINEVGHTETSHWNVCNNCKAKFDVVSAPYRVVIATRNLYAEK